MATTLAQRQYYRKRVKGSMCHKKAPKPCRKIKSCRMTKGSVKRSHFCRKKTNTRRQRGGKSKWCKSHPNTNVCSNSMNM